MRLHVQIRGDNLLRARNLMLYGTIWGNCALLEHALFQLIAFIASIVYIIGVYRFGKLTHAPLFALHVLMIAVEVFFIVLSILFPSSLSLLFGILSAVAEFLVFCKIYVLFFTLTDVWLFRSAIVLGGILLVQGIAAMLYFGHIFSTHALLAALSDSWHALGADTSFQTICLLFFLVVMVLMMCANVVVQIMAFYQIRCARMHVAA